MHVKGKEPLDLAAYRLKGVDIFLYEAWKQSRGTDTTSAMWKEFKKAFLTIIRADQFLNLHQRRYERERVHYQIQFLGQICS